MPAQRIPRTARNDILDWLSLSSHNWAGRMEDPDFLSRLYDLTALPSTDYRFHTAAEDISQHRVRNYDWDDDWVLSDPRFNLRASTDENMLNFLAETVHPAVRESADDAVAMVETFNGFLRPNGFELYPERRFGDRQVYRWREIVARRQPTETRLAAHPEISSVAVFQRHLKRIEQDLESEPPLAIDASKNLLESLCKTVLVDLKVEYDSGDDLPNLFTAVSRAIAINAEAVPADRRGSDAIRKAMRTLATTVTAVAEARNAIGEGHGQLEVSPAEAKHARLVFNAVVAVGEFILDTWRP